MCLVDLHYILYISSPIFMISSMSDGFELAFHCIVYSIMKKMKVDFILS